ncbi:hypothetical protein GGQ97_000865 [Sphingomonas kaistensis]|uniref:Uncharacterized protein n=1 Tax=Sphingomonas kaistensis TaxID=298708 RepID=A0A7X5Y5P9_9SPHN|nr:hypothetical protein [Sphingomonas kaistensis]NJC05072.1 hypothetical protein [Sphingomonas kaistensis]
MIEPLLVSLSAGGLAAGLILGIRSFPGRSVGPASAPQRRAMAFAGVFLLIFNWAALRLWLDYAIDGWPEAYTSCTRKCFYLAISPKLLGVGWRENALFLLLWSPFLLILAAFAWACVARVGIFARKEE